MHGPVKRRVAIERATMYNLHVETYRHDRESVMKTLVYGLVSAIVLGSTGLARAADPMGAGSTFVTPILTKWAADYRARTGKAVNYQSIGSGGGITQIKARSIDFAATDMPLAPDELRKLGLAQFPLVIGGVVPVINLDGIKSGQMRFSGPVLADIYLGKIKVWNDPAIQRLNPGLKLSATPIVVAHRLDGSGTTFNWANYLAKASPEWKDKVGEGTTVKWPLGLGGKGNEGVAVFVRQTTGAIGYVEYAVALKTKLAYGMVQNSAGQFPTPNMQSFQAAAAGASWDKADDFYLVITDAPGETAYPITATTFVLMHKQPRNPDAAMQALDFFKWSIESGQPQAEALDYVPLPNGLVRRIEDYWKVQFSGWKG
jgi:phosphate transport system substrate-binding protein